MLSHTWVFCEMSVTRLYIRICKCTETHLDNDKLQEHEISWNRVCQSNYPYQWCARAHERRRCISASLFPFEGIVLRRRHCMSYAIAVLPAPMLIMSPWVFQTSTWTRSRDLLRSANLLDRILIGRKQSRSRETNCIVVQAKLCISQQIYELEKERGRERERGIRCFKSLEGYRGALTFLRFAVN